MLVSKENCIHALHVSHTRASARECEPLYTGWRLLYLGVYTTEHQNYAYPEIAVNAGQRREFEVGELIVISHLYEW